ncbi:MAG: ABC transporter ATP-binding protein [Candidatus Methanomethylophilaceae archaeon]|nr:ABC transporter ATP-binding protein [Candidatus Methanomethylophilaceae archaeon]
MRFLTLKHWLLIAVMAGFVALQVWMDLEIPGYMTKITVLLNNGSPPEAIFEEGLGMILCSIGSVICSISAGGVAAYVASEYAKILRKEQFKKVQSFSPEEMSRFNIYSLITRSTNDVTQVQNAVARTSQLIVKVPVMVYIALTKVATGSWEWTEVTAIGIAAIIIVQSFMLFYVIPRYRKVQWFTDDMNRTVREGMSGVRVIRAFNAEEYQNKKADDANDALTENNLYASRLLAFTRPFNGVVQNILTVMIYLLGAGIIMAAATEEDALAVFSNMVVFSSYILYVVSSFILLAHVAMGLPRALVSARRINDVISTDITVVNGSRTQSEDTDVCISFRNVSFAYPDSSGDTLTGISFDVKRGETVAVIGQTGSGKTSLVNLIPRLFDTTGGSVYVDGVDVREYDLDALRSKIGYATQKPMLFSGTAGFNIGYGCKGVTDEQMMEAARAACIDGYLDSNEGLDTVIEQLGANLSGGQKQRISIARAVCKKPEIYIFDDTFSALDFKTDLKVRGNLKRITDKATTVIVSQRISTIADADRIIVISDGRIVGSGRHDELMRDCDIYKEMAKIQEFGEEGQ